MVRRAIITMTILMSSMAFSQGFEGIYQLEIEDSYGNAISRGTGFLVQSENSSKPYILTSFHLVNARLLEANGIKIKMQNGQDRYLNIAGYDELNDILALSADGLKDQPLNMSSTCSGELNVAGYHDGKLLAIDTEEEAGAFDKDINKLSVYLTKGFSGAPVMNQNVGVCGMVVLSSEKNASSIAISYTLINSFLGSIQQNTALFNVRGLRFLMGIEKIARTQTELDSILNNKPADKQVIVNIIPNDPNEKFLIKNVKNAIIEASGSIKRLVIHQSKNVMIRDINAERLIINESQSVTIASCLFDKSDKALFLKDSNDIMVSNNIFRNMNTSVVIKAAQIDTKNLLNTNNFQSVQNKIQNI